MELRDGFEDKKFEEVIFGDFLKGQQVIVESVNESGKIELNKELFRVKKVRKLEVYGDRLK